MNKCFLKKLSYLSFLLQDLLSLGKKRKRRTSNTQKSGLSESSDSDDELKKPKDKSNSPILPKEVDIADQAHVSREDCGKKSKNHEDGEVSDSDDGEEKDKLSEASDSNTNGSGSSSSSSESSSDSEFDDGYDENLMGDEEDRKRLSCLSEKERETEIFKRIEQRDIMRTRWEIERKLKLARRGEKAMTKKDSKVKKEKKKKIPRVVPSVLDAPKEPEPPIVQNDLKQPIDIESQTFSDQDNDIAAKTTADGLSSANGDYFDHKERSKERKKNVEMNRTDDKRSNAMALLKAKREGKAKRGMFTNLSYNFYSKFVVIYSWSVVFFLRIYQF